MTAINLLLVTHQYHPRLSGPAVRFHRYTAGFRRRDVHTTVVTSSSPGSPALDNFEGVPVVRLPVGRPKSPLSEPRFLWHLLRYLNDRRERADVLLFLNLSLASALVWPFLRKRGLPVVYVQTNIAPLSANAARRGLQKWNRQLPRQQASAIVTSSRAMLQNLQDMGVSRPRLEIIANGVDLARFRPPSTPDEKFRLRRALDLPLDKCLALFIGYLIPRKGIDVLVRAWREVQCSNPYAHLVLVGPRMNERTPSLRNFYAQLDHDLSLITDSVTLAGRRSNVEAYLRAADLFVFPSRLEGMPNVVPEAMASGLPVVMTPFLGMPADFGRPGKHYVSTDWTPESISDALISLLKSDHLRREIGRAGHDLITKNMDVERSLDQYTDLFRQLIRGNDT